MIACSIAQLAVAGLSTLAQAEPAPGASSSGLVFWLTLLVIMALAPFVLTMVTSFAKLVVVGGILRHAMGTQQIPPNTVITGLALILTVHIMSPVAARIYNRYEASAPPPKITTDSGNISTDQIRRIAIAAEGPMHDFLKQHSHPVNLRLFEDLKLKLAQTNGGTDAEVKISDPLVNDLISDVTILTPAFMLSQLTEAFQIGFLLFVPFLIIDLVVSNVLMAMGMQMMSPVTVSMPLKLLLFVLIDGWKLIMRGLVLSYM
ncbi:MAG TPA: flagellar type III secretion system pore protein FliP [Tepidisphaeraceae bacterium]|jgi:type III secretion protein R